DERAALLPRVDEPLRGQHLQRLTDRGQADPEVGLQVGHVDGRALRDLPGQDALRHHLHDLAVQSSCHTALNPRHTDLPHAESFAADHPPSTTRLAAVTYDASADNRNATTWATSSGCPSRPIAVAFALCSR